MKLRHAFGLCALLFLTACASKVDERYANRQVAYIDIQGNPPLNIAELQTSLQPALIAALQGRGQAPAVGLTVMIDYIGMPDAQNVGTSLFGGARTRASASGKVILWDPATRQPLTSFPLDVSTATRRVTLGHEIFGYAEYPTASEHYSKLAQAIAERVTYSLYRAN